MNKQSQKVSEDYRVSFNTTVLPEKVYEKIFDVSKWWSKRVEGNTKSGNIFIAGFKGGDWYKIKVEEDLNNKKIVWNVIDAEQVWHDKHKEWVNTKIIWEVLPLKNGSQVNMTHQGLVPEFECYEKCSVAWDFLLKESLFKYLTEGTGLPV